MIDLSSIPRKPGCYIYKNTVGRVVYVGKAKNLKKRVSSYFTKTHHDKKTLALVQIIDSVDFIITNTEKEALILENNLIKKYKPKYNILLKDSKRYAYLQLTKEEFPRLILARKKNAIGKFFGPFTSAQERDYIRQYLIKTFQLRTCKHLPKRACLRYHIKLCKAPCIDKTLEKEYDENIKKTSFILSGKTNQVTKDIEKQIKILSEKQNYEKAMELRDQLHSITNLSERQTMERNKNYNEDIINFIVRENKVYLTLFNIHKGMLLNKNEYVFDYVPEFIDQFLSQYYAENNIPKEIILPTNPNTDTKALIESQKGSKVRFLIPKKGEKKELLTLVKKNIELQYFGDEEKLEALKIKLKLNESPYVIECFDISHLSGTSVVGSMVQFRNAKPDKSNYRRFKIRTVEGIDDFAAIAEVVRRRYYRLKKENADFPDLIVIDGGKGQLSSALEELNNLNVKIPIISIAKREEEIFIPGRSSSIKLSRKDKGLQLVQKIRDEAHRFAITYNRLLRKKSLYD